MSRKMVVEEAMRWLGTPYHPRARLIGVGVDCAMFPAMVYEAVGCTPRINPSYNEDWMMHRDEEQFLAWVTPHAIEIPEKQLGPGDFVLWKFGRTYSHGAIVLNRPTIIHAVISAGAVILANMDQDEELRSRPRRCFTLWEGQ